MITSYRPICSFFVASHFRRRVRGVIRVIRRASIPPGLVRRLRDGAEQQSGSGSPDGAECFECCAFVRSLRCFGWPAEVWLLIRAEGLFEQLKEGPIRTSAYVKKRAGPSSELLRRPSKQELHQAFS